MNNLSSLLSKIKMSDNLLIYLAFFSVFLPYGVPIVFLVFACIYIALTKKIPYKLLTKNNIPWLLVFIAYSAIVGLLNGNFNGVGYSSGCFLMIYFCIFVKNTISEEIFEKCLTLSCVMGLITSFISMTDMAFFLLSGGTGKHRSTLYFFNCNYLATMLAIVVIICAYKFLLGKCNRLFCVFTALCCAVAMYLTGSMFVWIEVFVGIAALLKTTRRGQLLSILLLTLSIIIIILDFVPELIPRVQDLFVTTTNRKGIWQISIKAFKSSPIFGRGFMTYKHIRSDYTGAYPTSHSHNIFIECLMDFGIVGTTILLVYIIKYIKRLFICRSAQFKIFISSLIISLLCSVVAHGTTDLTFLWTQTGLFYCLLMSGIGPEEKLLGNVLHK